MDKLPPAERTSANLIAANIAALQQLFPELVTEGKDGAVVNVDVLKELVGDRTVTDAEERFGLNWHGKRAARRLALTPSLGTLRPCPEESVDWETTQNLMIEGDNLEVLKLLQKSYAGKVKLIYIDPPYNTGNDFVYPDDFSEGIDNYLRLTGQRSSDGSAARTQQETSGRFHSNWLNMMYPRLRLARELLSADGVGLVSLDSNELCHCQEILKEIYGGENYVATIVWVSNLKGRQISDGGPVGTHEYILCFSKAIEKIAQFRGSGSELRRLMPSVYKGDGYEVKHDQVGPYVTKNELYNTNSKFHERSAPTMVYRIHYNFDSGEVRVSDIDDDVSFPGFVLIMPHRNARPDAKYHAWRWSREKVLRESAELEFIRSGDSAKIFTKIRDTDGMAIKDLILGPSTTSGHDALSTLGLDGAFDTPKPVEMLALLIGAVTQGNDLVFDFFAGSGTLAQATMVQNAADRGARRFAVVQLPEQLSTEVETQKRASSLCDKLGKPRTIAEITKERLRRAGAKVRKDNPLFAGDLGFRVFKLDSTNLREWDSDPKSNEAQLELSAEHLKRDRSELDILYEVLLKAGYDLCSPVAERSLGGKTVRMVGGGVLFACLASRISRDEVEALATGMVQWRKAVDPIGDTSAYFRDDAFADDVAKTNLSLILKQGGFKTVRSL